jgi:hypothetical protein
MFIGLLKWFKEPISFVSGAVFKTSTRDDSSAVAQSWIVLSTLALRCQFCSSGTGKERSEYFAVVE